jgi:hypothetical protein
MRARARAFPASACARGAHFEKHRHLAVLHVCAHVPVGHARRVQRRQLGELVEVRREERGAANASREVF